MKLGWTTFNDFVKYRKQCPPSSPSVGVFTFLALIIGLAVLITLFVTGIKH
jgi:hypothetical protein